MMKTMQQENVTTATAATLIVLVAVLLSPVCSFAQLPAATLPDSVGVNTGSEAIPVMSQIKSGLSANYIRADLKWQTVEPDPAIPGKYTWQAYDTLAATARHNGVRIIFVLDYNNTLYDFGYSPNDDTGRTAFANYAVASVAHFQGTEIIWEIYNEPQNFWTRNGPSSVGLYTAPDYAALAYTTAKAIHDAYPNTTVIAPAVDAVDSLNHAQFQNMKTILIAMLAQPVVVGQPSICTYLSAISIHPYRKTGTSPETFVNDYPQIRQVIDQQPGCAGKPIVTSEWGVTASQFEPPTGTLSVADAEKMKAEYDARILLVDLMLGIPLTNLYSWEDGLNPSNSGDNFGLVAHYDGTVPNPTIYPLTAYNAVKTLSDQLLGHYYETRLTTNDPTDYLLKFSKNLSDYRFVCWNSAGTAHTVNVPVGANHQVTVTNFDGSSTTYATGDANGNYACTTSAGPQYILLGP